MSGNLEKITMKDGKLTVPDNPTVLYIEGDGIGSEIWGVAENIFNTAVREAYNGEREVNWQEVYAGDKATARTGSPLPFETLALLDEFLVGIKGPLGTPTGEGHRSLNVTMRQNLDLYACVRPFRYFDGVPSPVKHPEQVDLVIFRENTEDIYAGIEWEQGTSEATSLIKYMTENLGVDSLRFPDSSSIGIKPISVEGSKRLVRAAIQHALKIGKKNVTLVHKGNIQKFTEGGFLKWGHEVAEQEFAEELANGSLVINDMIADNFFQQALLYPSQFDVVAMTNLNGDYASDAVAAQVGGIGISPGANINYVTGHAVFEATHGTAPDIAGKNLANPCSVLLSGAMLFDYIGWTEVHDLIIEAISKTISSGVVTGDFARLMDGVTAVGTTQFGDEIVKHITAGL